MSLIHRLKPLIQKVVTGAGLVTRPMTLGARVLVRDGEGRIVLVRHTYLPGWYLPGGGVDPGETTAAAAQRELAEEAGFETGSLTLFGLYLNARVSRRDHVALYVGEGVTPLPAARIPAAEIAEVGRFAADALPEETTGATRRRIAEVLGAAPREEIW